MATIKKNFNTFTEGTSLSLTDRIVGFSDTNFGGERKWSFQTFLNNITTKSPSTVKAWICYRPQIQTIDSQFNVSGIVRNSAGLYTITFATPFSNNKYAVAGQVSDDNNDFTSGGGYEAWTIATNYNHIREAGRFQFSTTWSSAKGYGNRTDPQTVSLAFFGY